jgi:hypothetical protein
MVVVVVVVVGLVGTNSSIFAATRMEQALVRAVVRLLVALGVEAVSARRQCGKQHQPLPDGCGRGNPSLTLFILD